MPPSSKLAGRLRQLDYLFIDASTNLSDRGIGALSGHPRLRQVVVLNATRLTDASMGVLAALPNLRN